MINIPAVQTMSDSQLRDTVQEMVEQAASRDLVRDIFMADIGPDVLDATVQSFVAAVNAAFA